MALYLEREPIGVYSFHTKYSLSPSQVASFIIKCEEKKLVIYNEGNILLSEAGVNYVNENKEALAFEINEYWKKVPEWMSKGTVEEHAVKYYPLSTNDVKSFLSYLRK